MADDPAPPRGPVARLATGLALAGGATLLATALLTTYSVVQRWITRQPVPGDFELGMFAMLEAVIPNQSATLDQMDVNDFTEMFTTWNNEYTALTGASLGESSGSSS